MDRVEGSELHRRAAVRDVEPERGERFARTEERWGVLPNLSFSTLQALQTGQPQVIPSVTPAYLQAAAIDPEHFTELMGLVLRSWVVVPLQTPSAGVMGALRLARAGVRPPFDHDDVQLAMRVAELASPGLANALAHAAARSSGGSRERQAAALARELEEAVRALARARSTLAPRSAAGLDIGHAAERLRTVIRDLQDGSRTPKVSAPPA